MNSAPKQKNERPSSNFEEEAPKGKVPSGDKVVKKPEDEEYHEEDANFKKRREGHEQPVDPIKTPPKD